MRNKLRDKPYHRANISHRCAVRTLEKIQEVLNPKYGTISWMCWNHNDNWDSAVYYMAEEIRRYKYYAEKYFELSALLKKAVE